MANTVNESAIKKLKLLFTVVDRNKAEFYLDVLNQFPINCQMAMAGTGTAHSELVELLGCGDVLDGTIDVINYVPEARTLPLETDKINRLLHIKPTFCTFYNITYEKVCIENLSIIKDMLFLWFKVFEL